ncbi:hypothetical protein YC2023_116700 [Brassica napus]
MASHLAVTAPPEQDSNVHLINLFGTFANYNIYMSTGGHRERLRSRQRRNIGHDVEAPTGLETPQKISPVEKK